MNDAPIASLNPSQSLANQSESAPFKHLAAMGLYQLGGSQAEQALLENAFAPE